MAENIISSDIVKKFPYIIAGLRDYFLVEYPYNDQRLIGFTYGKQIIGLYLVELLLKGDLEGNTRGHNLLGLYQNISRVNRKKVEKSYNKCLPQIKSCLDIHQSVESFLDYLGEDPITSTRYFWEKDSHDYSEGNSIFDKPG